MFFVLCFRVYDLNFTISCWESNLHNTYTNTIEHIYIYVLYVYVRLRRYNFILEKKGQDEKKEELRIDKIMFALNAQCCHSIRNALYLCVNLSGQEHAKRNGYSGFTISTSISLTILFLYIVICVNF